MDRIGGIASQSPLVDPTKPSLPLVLRPGMSYLRPQRTKEVVAMVVVPMLVQPGHRQRGTPAVRRHLACRYQELSVGLSLGSWRRRLSKWLSR